MRRNTLAAAGPAGLRRRGAVLVLMVAILAVVLAACGGGETQQASLPQRQATEDGQAGGQTVGIAADGAADRGAKQCPLTLAQVNNALGARLREGPPLLGSESEYLVCNFTNNPEDAEGFPQQRDATVYLFPTPEGERTIAAERRKVDRELPGDQIFSEHKWGSGAFYDVIHLSAASLWVATVFLPRFEIHIDAYGEVSKGQIQAMAQKIGDAAAP